MASVVVGLFLVSFSLLSLEIVFTRVLSVLLSYHYVFLAVSLALMGLGLGGLWAHFARPRTAGQDGGPRSLSLHASLYAFCVAAAPLLIIFVSRQERIRDNVLIFSLILFLPFLLAGRVLAEVFRAFSAMSARLYGADLAGAAAAAVGAVLTLNAFGGMTAIFFLAVIASVAALLFALAGRDGKNGPVLPPLAALALSVVLLGAGLTGRLAAGLAGGANPAKEIHDVLSRPEFRGKIVESRWSAFGRTDLVEFEGYPDQMEIYLDGTAGTPMYRFSGAVDDPEPAVRSLRTSFSGYFPFLFLKENERDDALIIGPGGGRDILVMLLGGVKRITAVEVNKDLVDIVRGHARYNGGIYSGFANVRIVVDDGRNFLKRQKSRYDLIMLSLPVTATSRSLEGFALTENYLFTADSIKDYVGHLTDEGRLIVVCHGDAEVSRLLILSLSALKDMAIGQAEAMTRICVLGSEKYPVFVLKKTPFDPEVASSMADSLGHFGVRPDASYFPYVRKGETRRSMLTALGDGRLSPEGFERRIRALGYDVGPVSDDRPFFYKLEPGLPKAVARGLWISALLALIALAAPLLDRGTRKGPSPRDPRLIVLFPLLGLGFMLVEISLIQKFVLFLGQPVLAMSVILFSLLAGAAGGSLSSGRIATGRLTGSLARASLAVFAVVLVYSAVLPPALGRILGLSPPLRLIMAGILLVPLGFFMGFPFPLALRALDARKAGDLIPWMWGLNGACSVLGSTAAVAIGILAGFSRAFLAGGFCYLAAFALFVGSGPARARHGRG
ncbi:MAG: hypothetical protein ABFD52_06875 [Acidobacteriota bacterium]